MMHTDKQRERIEKEQDLKSQEHAIAAAQAADRAIGEAIAQIGADYRRGCRPSASRRRRRPTRLREELAKQEHRHGLLELRAPQAGMVKDLATHTPGTVVAPGTILMTIVPEGEKLRAEVWVSNDDIGFVHTGAARQDQAGVVPVPEVRHAARAPWQQVSADCDRGAESQHALGQPRGSRSPRRRRSPSAPSSTWSSSNWRATASATPSRPACR